MTTVYASAGGHRYHASRDCRPMWAARQFWRFDPMEWVPGMPQVMLTDGRDIHPTTPTEALAAGKTPCRACYPDAADLGHSEDDFGHQQTSWGGRRICTRCATGPVPEAPDASDPLPTPDRSVAWPCTTARILGLVSQGDQ
ncbi:hypothetical protein ACFXB3_07145 [Streptomyces sp. NPDC059447]|uniref:hypothetical protein n=1 Tax=Streptomyces sp. NPDC059447 TaxID=3346834 RepID=UPI0036A41996